MANVYTISELFSTAYALFVTNLFYRPARLIRRPCYIRGKKHIKISKGLTTGHNCRFDLGGAGITLVLGRGIEIGDNVHIVAHKNVTIGDHCLLASKIFISDTSHGIYDNSINSSKPEDIPNNRLLFSKPVWIGKNCWIGENVTILSGVKIGNGCIIGANSVVNKSFPDYVIIAGVPAKIIKVFNTTTELWESC